MMRLRASIGCVVFSLTLLGFLTTGLNARPRAKKIVLIAGEKSHGPGVHEYEKDLQLLKHCLGTSPSLDNIRTELHLNGWPKDPATLDDADTIVLFSDGADQAEQRHPILVGNRIKVIEKQMKRGCGLVLQHYATIVPKRLENKWFEWLGGYFDYEGGKGEKPWFSKIKWARTRPKLTTPQHPISRGIRPFELHEEYYYNIRFRPDEARFVPIMSTPIPGQDKDHVVAWAIERTNGGRSFATTCGHTHANFELPDFRKLHLNAIIWTAGMDVPPGGVQSTLPPDFKPLKRADTWDPNSAIQGKPIRALIVTGHEYPGHKWQQTSQALREAMWQDPRFLADTTHNPEMLGQPDITQYDVLVFNYCNWERPGLSERAKDGLINYASGGGGLCFIHFANGAFNYSLPGAEQSDWPQYRKICRRVWIHGKSGHDPYGHFLVETTDTHHPITEGLKPFETIDELYFNQQGDLPIDVLAVAHSKSTDKDEPIAWVYNYGKGRVFQTLLGHSAESLRVEGAAALIRRGCIWAGRAE